MTTNLKEERIRELKESIIDSVNKKVAEAVIVLSAREKNLLLNDFEYALGKINLESTPEGIGIGAHYHCNTKCIFCLGGEPKLFSLERYKEFFEPKLGSAISKARYVNFCGFGELLLMPGIEQFLGYVNANIPEVNKIYTTNGAPLMNNEVLTLLTQSRSVVEVSLHASNSQLHRLLTKMNTFEQIVSQIKQLVSMRKRQGYPTVSLVFLANTLNIENLPDFIEFARGLGADEVISNYMTVFTPAHLKLSCFFKQEITNESFERAQERAKQLNFTLKLPPRFGLNNEAKTSTVGLATCSDPWKYFYVENEGSVLPCCYAGYHIGYLNQVDFNTLWNGTHYRHLRSSLVEGKPHEWCRHCFKYRARNINDIRSHVSFRPNLREKILKGYKFI